MSDTSEPRSNLIVVIGVVSTLLLIVICIAMAYYFQIVYQQTVHENVELAPATKLRSLRATENEMLNKYAYVDKEAGVVRIPIERAIELEVESPWRQSARLSGETGPLPQ